MIVSIFPVSAKLPPCKNADNNGPMFRTRCKNADNNGPGNDLGYGPGCDLRYDLDMATARIQLARSQDTARIQLGYSQDTAEIQLRYS